MTWVFYALCAAFFAAAMTIFAKIGLHTIDATLATTIRSVIMAVFLVVVSMFLKKFEGFSFTSLDTKGWLFIVLAALSGALSWLFYFAALKFGFASRVAAIDRLSIVFVVLLSSFFLGEALGIKTVLGALLMMGGVLLISL